MQAGDIIDNRWEIVSRLGSGAHGMVFRARSVSNHADEVALKILQLGGLDAPMARFMRAAEMLARIEHPNIVHFRGAGHSSDPVYTVMELVNGRPLSSLLHRLAGQPMSLLDVVNIGTQVSSALAYLHTTLQICHRDLKPANLMLQEKNGQLHVKLVDFGIALDTNTQTRLTQHGLLLGTLLYTPPEWGFTDTLNPYAWDAFSLGAVLYKCLCGSLPYQTKGEKITQGKSLVRFLDNKQNLVPLIPGENYPPAFRTLMRDITRPEPSERLSDLSLINRRLEALLRALQETPPVIFRLHCLNGEREEVVYPLRWGSNILGRSGADVDLSEQEANQPRRWVSRSHAEIHIGEYGLCIRDRGSTNGTYVNEAPLLPEQDYIIKPGDLIHLGRLSLKVSTLDAASSDTGR